MPEWNNNDRTLKDPLNTNLPFFAYSIFKPEQIAYSKIKKYVSYYKNIEINYKMKLRDGVPILINKENEKYSTKGFLITFKDLNHEDAYNTINKTMSNKLYEWQTITIDENEVNVLIGLEPENGSMDILNYNEQNNFDGKNDPLFKEGIEIIENNLKSNENSCETIENFFQIQMNYMLLWSAIERFSSLKYNKRTKRENNYEFAKEKAFKNGIKEFKKKNRKCVYSNEDLRKYCFNHENPKYAINYYYTLRCNVVHRGKTGIMDYMMLKEATNELLKIFKNILNDAFKE